MQLSDRGASDLILHEGVVLHWYADPVGVGTIGVGFTWRSRAFRTWWELHKGNTPFRKGATITRAQAMDALKYIVDREYVAAVDRFLGDKEVPQNVYDAMVSMVYNLGAGSLNWKWAAAIKRGDYKEAARLTRITGTTARGKKLAGLVRRRKETGDLIEFGRYASGGTTTVPPRDAMADGILQRKERGPAVAALIRDLNVLGFYDGVLDDIFGWGTHRAVVEFQKAHGLKVDGLVGKNTFAALKKALTKAGFNNGLLSMEIKEEEKEGPSTADKIVAGGTGLTVVGAVAASAMTGQWKWLLVAGLAGLTLMILWDFIKRRR